MKIILLSGPGEIGKRNEILKLKKQFSPDCVITCDLQEKSLEDLKIALSSNLLFATGPRLLVVENVTDQINLQTLAVSDPDLTLLLKADSLKSDSSLLTSAKKLRAKIFLFEGEKELSAFPFLDYLIEKRKQAFLELEKLLKEYGSMYVLVMIYYLLRRNILPLPQNEFARRKIQAQKQKYQLSDFENFYKLALILEFSIKSGALEEKLGLTSFVQSMVGENGKLRE